MKFRAEEFRDSIVWLLKKNSRMKYYDVMNTLYRSERESILEIGSAFIGGYIYMKKAWGVDFIGSVDKFHIKITDEWMELLKDSGDDNLSDYWVEKLGKGTVDTREFSEYNWRNDIIITVRDIIEANSANEELWDRYKEDLEIARCFEHLKDDVSWRLKL